MTTDPEDRAIATARLLALDVVESHGHGHAGAPMGLAPVGHVLFQDVLRHDPLDPAWEGRDRLVLSAGHASLWLYVQLFLTGYGLTLADLRATRTMGSRTPGHPERGVTPGVEMTTGPLGQGVASAVGLAMSLRHLQGLAGPGCPLAEQTVWCVASDGDLQEGVSAEASSLAGTLRLANLVVVWDDNSVSIDGGSELAFTEDVAGRYAAYGWQVIEADAADTRRLRLALTAARAETGRPTFVAVKSTIGWPTPGVEGTAAAHAGAYGAAAVAAAKRALGFDPERSFHVDADVLAYTREAAQRGARLHKDWDERLAAWRASHPRQAERIDRLSLHRDDVRLPAPRPAGENVPTRRANGQVVTALVADGAAIWGGSADLAESTSVALPDHTAFSADDPAGRHIHFGVREHAMAAILNGIALHGWFRPYGSTYLTFSDYARPSLRLAALMRLPVVTVFTHDSLAVGEDGPTHQPVEQLWSLRMVPGLDVVRPADATETFAVWRRIWDTANRPTALVLSRQALPSLDPELTRDATRGGYVVRAAERPDVLLLATGSELHLALEAAGQLREAGLDPQVVSMPCLEWFAEQPQAYRDEVLPPAVRARVSVEAGVEGGWWRWLGSYGQAVSVRDFGESGPGDVVMERAGLTVAAVVAAAHRSLDLASRSDS
jgi:transketolase